MFGFNEVEVDGNPPRGRLNTLDGDLADHDGPEFTSWNFCGNRCLEKLLLANISNMGKKNISFLRKSILLFAYGTFWEPTVSFFNLGKVNR